MESKKRVVLACVLLACIGIIVVMLQQRTALSLSRLGYVQCPKPGTGKFTLHPVPSTALVSYPGSGNSWTRFLLTTASGILTAGVYHTFHDVLVSKGFTAKAQRVLAVKTHKGPEDTSKSFHYDRCILIIRNPYEAFLAEYNRARIRKPWPQTHQHVLSAETFKGWPSFVSHKMRGWSRVYHRWLEDCQPSSRLHVLVYSRMMNNLGHELHEVFRFLNISSITPMVDCAVRYREGEIRRAEHDWQKEVAVFTQEQIQVLNAAIDGLQRALEKATGQSFQDLQDWKR